MGRGSAGRAPVGHRCQQLPECVEVIGHLSEQGLVNVEPTARPNFDLIL